MKFSVHKRSEHPKPSNNSNHRGNSSSNNMQATTEAVLDDLVANSNFFTGEKPIRPIPAFDPEEVRLGKELGRGEFGVVHEVAALCDQGCECDVESVPLTQIYQELMAPYKRQIVTASDTTSEMTLDSSMEGLTVPEGIVNMHEMGDFDGGESDDDEMVLLAKNNTRQSMSQQTHREGVARYAVKRLQRQLTGNLRLDAAIDLACEALFLQSIRHTNIVHLRGTVGVPGTPGFAIMLDRLTETLEEKFVLWENLKAKYSGKFFGLVGKRQSNLNDLLTEQLLVAFDVARAMKFLHQRSVLYRDIKPENIGFNVRGDVQIFDFGLAKELKPQDLVDPPDGYECTGLTGSRRFMAPEVVRCLSYGLKADVYSFVILLWQVCSLKTPFLNMDSDKHFDQVILKHKRPKKLPSLPPQVHLMMEESWSEDPSRRPTFKMICQILQVVITDRIKGLGSSLVDRSKHLLDRSLRSLESEEY